MSENLSADLIKDILKEKRADRRWKNIRFIAWFLLILGVIAAITWQMNPPPIHSSEGRYVNLIRLEGMISPGKDFSAETVIPLLRGALSDKSAVGVILDIDSGGGTPVQAAIIHDAILSLKKKYHKKVVVVGEDLLTSGAYYIAVAADKIYVNPNTLTGSIGVVMKSFGFVELMKKLGVERRVYVAGSDKDRLDPFLPQNPSDLEKINHVMQEVHENFTKAVIAGRGSKLQGDPKILFSGDFWSGQTALQLGLVDGLGNLLDVMEKEFQASRYQEYNGTPNLFRILMNQFTTAWENVVYLS